MTDETGTIPADAAGTNFGDDGLLMRFYDGELEGEELARALGVPPEDPKTDGVEGPQPHIGGLGSQAACHTLPHLPSRLVGKGDG